MSEQKDESLVDATSHTSSAESTKEPTISELAETLDQAVEWIEKHPSETEDKMPAPLQDALGKFGEGIDLKLKKSELGNWLSEQGLSDRVVNYGVAAFKDVPSCPTCDRLAIEMNQSESGVGKVLFWIVGGIIYIICWQAFGWPGWISAIPAAIVGGMCTMIGSSVSAKCLSCGHQWKP